MLVCLMQKSGASKAYGNWAVKNIKTKRGSLLSTMGLGILIFVDDYFNCLTVGTIMSPITDKHKISRAKLAYIIDATAAPICILSPVSSWAAAVSSSLPDTGEMDGFVMFLKTIPFNYYAIFTIVMILMLVILDFDFSRMKEYELKYGNSITGKGDETADLGGNNGKVYDLIIPIASLVIFCVAAMLYTGGILDGVGVIDAFANCSSAFSLVIGAFFTMIVTAALYLPRKVITFKEYAASLTEGFKAMVPAILILTFAWTLSTVLRDDYLRIGDYVSGVMSNSSLNFAIIPGIFFLVAFGLGFATGTSWGTFAILLPIVYEVFGGDPSSTLMFIAMSAVLAGGVCGDHTSPISDTTILSSTGAQCDHIEHVNTQIPYALFIAAISFVSYIISGFTGKGIFGFVFGVAAVIIILAAIKKKQK